MESKDAYNLEVALCFAMTIAPTMTVALHIDSEYTQLCIPMLSGPGLDDLGVTISETGEIMLRAFVTVVHNIYITECGKYEAPLQPFARTHKLKP